MGYSDALLEKFGSPKGSTFAMTPNGYMNEEAWVEITPKIVSGIRNCTYVRDMPHWYCLKIVDGYGPHTTSLEAMRQYSDAKIILMKEEGDSSHVNQSYDREPPFEFSKPPRST